MEIRYGEGEDALVVTVDELRQQLSEVAPEIYARKYPLSQTTPLAPRYGKAAFYAQIARNNKKNRDRIRSRPGCANQRFLRHGATIA